MNQIDKPLVQELVDSLRRLMRAIYLDTLKTSQSFGLTGPQSAVLRALSAWGPLSSASLSRTLYVTPSNITGIIDRLVKKELVERVKKEGDRRVTLISLTRAGEDISEQLPDPIEKKLIVGLAKLTPEHARGLAEAMNEINDFINAPELEE
jgi:DNA-binding MarR family transcriptional regulator